MKRMLIAILLLSLTALLLVGCGARIGKGAEPDGPTPEVDGGVTDRSDPDAPKALPSSPIASFDCRFSTTLAVEPGALGNHIYKLAAKLDGGAVKGSYQMQDKEAARVFNADHSFLDDVYELLERYDVAQLNGHDVEVHGLPDEFGVELDVVFWSGEHLTVYDNRDNVLPYHFLNETVKLFERGAATPPTVLDLEVNTHFEHHEIEGGFGEVSVPVYGLGYRDSNGELVPPDGYSGLKDTIAALDAGLLLGVDTAWDRFGTASGDRVLYCRTESFVTRADSEAVSFYERTRRCEDAAQQNEFTEIVAHNLDARTGRELTFADVFRDMDYLPSLLLLEFSRAYPDLTFYDDALDFIRQSVEGNDGNISFALGYGFVHVFANEFVLCDAPGELHATISYVLNPGQVRAFYTTEPLRWIVPADYGTNYWRGDVSRCFRIQSTLGGDDSGTVTWEVLADDAPAGSGYAESFYGRAPDCWIARLNGYDFIYLRVPTGDVSMLTNVYEVTEFGVVKRKSDLPLAIRASTPLDPNRLLMISNQVVLAEPVSMLPHADYRLNEGGLPEMVSDVYDLDGAWVRLRRDGRYNPDSRDNAAVSGGMWTLIAGQALKPFQSDLNSFVDFITDDGRVVRFAIDRFDDDMTFDGQSSDELFSRDATAAG